MEAHNLFPDHVHAGPVFFVLALVFLSVSERRNVVRQRVEPDINHVLGIVGHRDAPGERAAADGEIAQAAAHERNHFVAPRLRADEVWLLGVELDQLLFEARELEVIVLFVNGFCRASAIRTRGAGPDRIHVKLVVNAVLASVRALVDVSVVANFTPQSLHALLVALGRCANEIVVGEAEALPACTESFGDLIGKLLRSFAGCLRRSLDLLSVLIGACQEPGVVAQHAMPASDRIAGNRRVGVSNVRTRIHVVDWGRDVELLAHSGFRYSPRKFFTTGVAENHGGFLCVSL